MRLPADFAVREADPRRGRADPGRRARVRSRGRLARRAEVPLRILILGGTKFLGRAIDRGGARARARADALQPRRDRPRALPGGRAAARRPEARPLARSRAHVGRGRSTRPATCRRTSARRPSGCATSGRYVFISSVSAYADFSTRPTEASPVAELGELPIDEVAPDYSNYGAAEGALRSGGRAGVRRARADRAAGADRRAARPDRPLHVLGAAASRAAARCSRPGPPERHAQFVDVRDLADLDPGRGRGRALGDLQCDRTRACRGASCWPARTSRGSRTSSCRSTRSDRGWSCRSGSPTRGWEGMPKSMSAERSPRACASGRSRRRSQGQPAAPAVEGVGLTPEREAELLEAWRAR